MKKPAILIALCWIGIFSGFAQSPGNALDFDGTADYVMAPLPDIFMNLSSNDFTVETWVMPQGNGTERIFFAELDDI